MRLVILFVTLTGGLGATDPNLPGQAPVKWTNTANPLAGDSRARKAGAKLYQRECAACHGAAAGGLGRAPSLRQASVSGARPGALYWIIENGAIYHGMPSFAHLPGRERWQIVTFLQGLNSRKDSN